MSASLGDTAVELPWLAPNVASLVALTRPHRPESWAVVRSDPAAVLLLFRHFPHDRPPEPFRPMAYALPAVRSARERLASPAAGVLDRGHAAVRATLTAAGRYAALARLLAERSGRGDPECAAAAALVAPLGRLAVAAIEPGAAAEAGPETARRLARRWGLPAWLSAVVGYLDLPADLATTIGAEPDLFAIVQAAVSLAARGGEALPLKVGTPLDELLARLELDESIVDGLARPSADLESAGSNPYEASLLRDLLDVAVDNGERREVGLVARLETEVDDLHHLLLDQRAGEAGRLRDSKLTALAEFAAGAGHEINNPLAVISGQAQYLLGQEADAERQKALRTVIQQSQRIHQVLTDLMQFSRPARPQKQAIEIRDVVRQAAGTLADLAAQREVRVEVLTPDETCRTDGDTKQLQTAVACLLRNAVEAAAASGWARVRVEVPATDLLRVVVEDSGPGPSASHVEHLFDPFFSGRPAGRGRGLGLPTAWRLAREQGGDVAYEALSGGPTRFVLTLPRIAVLPLTQPTAA